MGSMRMCIALIVMLVLTLVFDCRFAAAAEEMQYKQFKLDDVSCDVGLMYKKTPDGMVIRVSAISYGKGAEFRKWKISDIKLHIGQDRIRPDRTNKFYVTKENFWKYPSAILFAVIGAQIPVSGSSLDKGIARTGAAIGLGLLTLQAQGDITGEQCQFDIDTAAAGRIIEGADAIEIILEHPDLHRKETVRIGLARSPAKSATCDECARMDQAGLIKMVDDLAGQVKTLENEQASFKYGEDPQFDKLQRDIEYLEMKRGIAYKTWLERGGSE